MGNSTSNTRRNVIRGIVALIIILIILLCLRLCKHDKEEVPTPQPTPSASTPQDTIKQDTTTVFPKAWQKVSKPKRRRKVIAASVLQPAEKVAVIEKKEEPAVVQETPKEQPKQQAVVEPESDDVAIEIQRKSFVSPNKNVFSHISIITKPVSAFVSAWVTASLATSVLWSKMVPFARAIRWKKVAHWFPR